MRKVFFAIGLIFIGTSIVVLLYIINICLSVGGWEAPICVWNLEWLMPFFVIFLIVGFMCIINGVRFEKTLGSELAWAQKHLAEHQYISAAIHFRKAAQVYIKNSKDLTLSEDIKQQNIENAQKYFKKAVETYFSSEKYEGFVDFIKNHTHKFMPTPNDQIELIKEAANKLLKVGKHKNAANLVKKISSIYKKKLLQNLEKATYYKILAPQVKAGMIVTIE